MIELPELPKDYQRYVLDQDHNPVPCQDETIWREFMSKPENVLVGHHQGEDFEVTTTFLGFNYGNVDQHLFFQTSIKYTDHMDPSPSYEATWDSAKQTHEIKIESIISLINYAALVESDNPPKMFKPVDCKLLPGEIHFILESEQAAIDGLPENTEHWQRRGNVIVFLTSKERTN